MLLESNRTTMNATNNSTSDHTQRIALATIYTTVLVFGTVGVVLMITSLKSNARSLTTIAVLNLVVVHAIFLLTVPFRIYYYVSAQWTLGPELCKVVSGMVHGHMYIAFLFYGIILGLRYHTFYRRESQLEFYRKLHALGASVAVWAVGLLIGLPVLFFIYGSDQPPDEIRCFKFGRTLQDYTAAMVLNYVVSSMVLAIAVALTCCQAQILWCICRQHGAAAYSQQEFGAQKKSLCFILVVVVCFVPYHIFRLYYIGHVLQLENENEVFLSVTTVSCLDSLIFLGKSSICV